MIRFTKWFLVVIIAIFLAACGEKSQQSIVKEVGKTWGDSNYELQAQVEIKTADTPRIYDVSVWHTKPSYYRVELKEQSSDESQIIVKNKDGVFLVSPNSNKTFTFQSDWPSKNSQSYLIETLAEDLQADKKASMSKDGEFYTFDVATRNAERTGLPLQQIAVDKKTLLPSKVSLFNEDLTEQITISFKTINLKVKHKPEDYAVKPATNVKENTSISGESFPVYYPLVQLPNTNLADEKIVRDVGKERAVLSYNGEKSYTIIQQPSNGSDKMVTVSTNGYPEIIGSSVGIVEDQSIRWEYEGLSFLLISNDLTVPELLQVAASIKVNNGK